MRKHARVITYSVLPLLLAAIPAVLLAASPRSHGPHGPHGPGFSDMFLDRIADKLELTDSQRQEIRGVFEAYRPQSEELVVALRDAHQVLGDRAHAEPFDEAAIREAAATVGETLTELAVLRARMHDEMRQFLTPEQKEKAREMHDLVEGHPGLHHGRGH